ncbi:hypothetical protein SAMN04487981_1274 [Streptomyces sp. cf386]|nr:hypothetical protein SAMN04487981_1274 [Streptomyces sp. cf386]
MIAAALDAGVTASWVTGDEAYGQDPRLRALLEARGTGYVLAVACSTRVRINHGRTAVRADTVAGQLPVTAWHRQSAVTSAKGPRHYDWAWIHICIGAIRHLLIRRNRSTGEHAFYLCWSPATVSLAFLTADAAPQRPAGPHHFDHRRDPITLTVPQIRRLFGAVCNPPAVSTARLLQWSFWRRHHQATARRSHYRRRTLGRAH